MSINKPFRVKNELVVNSTFANVALEVHSNDAVKLPTGNTGQRPTGANGHFRYNSETKTLEAYANNTTWLSVKYETAPSFNYVVNPTMALIPQGYTAANTMDGSFFVAEMWTPEGNYATNPVNCSITDSVTYLRTPEGSVNRLRVFCDSALTPTFANFHAIRQRIEGRRCRNLQWGTANAKSIILRFGIKAPEGTYYCALRNVTATSSYIIPYTITAAESNTDVVKVFSIPGPTSGSFPTTNTASLEIWLTNMTGSAYANSTTETWLSGNYIGGPSYNRFSVANQTIEYFDVGLYADPNNLGVNGCPRFYGRNSYENYDRIDTSRYYMRYKVAGGGFAANYATSGFQYQWGGYIRFWCPQMRTGSWSMSHTLSSGTEQNCTYNGFGVSNTGGGLYCNVNATGGYRIYQREYGINARM